MVDLAGLDQDAARVCAAAMALPPAEGRALLPALEAVAHQIDALAASIGAP